jgi:hypothetical protein
MMEHVLDVFHPSAQHVTHTIDITQLNKRGHDIWQAQPYGYQVNKERQHQQFTTIITRVNEKHRSRILATIRVLLLASHPHAGRSSSLHSLFSSPLYDVHMMRHILSFLYQPLPTTAAETQMARLAREAARVRAVAS